MFPAIWQWVKSRFSGNTLKNPPDWFREFVGGVETDAGIRVDGKTALAYSTLWQGVNVIAGDVGMMPLVCYERIDDHARDKALRHPAYRRMRRSPNPEMSASTFKQTLQQHALLWGNGYARIIRDGTGLPSALFIRRPDMTQVHRDEFGLFYESKIETSPGIYETEVTPARDMFHLKGLGWDGTKGYSVISYARNSWAMGLAQEKYGSAFFKNNARPGGYIEAGAGTSPEGAAEMLRSWRERHEGTAKAHTMGVLANAKYVQLGIPNEDAQFIESRVFQRQEVASWLNLPPHKVNDMTNATFSNIEELNRNYLNTSLMRWLVAWEDECYDKLLTERQKRADSHFFEFNTASLLRGTLLQRYQAYQVGIAGTWLSPNDVRAFENMNPRPGGDKYENPNTSSPEPKETVPPDKAIEDEKPQDEPAEKTDAVARRLIAASLRRMIRSECRNVLQFAKTSKNFIRSIEDYYDRFSAGMLEIVSAAGGNESDVDGYCEQSKSQILDVAGRAKPAELEEAITNLISGWPDRAEALADRISKGGDNGHEQAA